MPTSPRWVCRLSGQRKRTRPYRQHPDRCAHRSLRKATCVFSVGGDAHIAPLGMSPERSEKTDTPIPSASGPMWASAPTKSNLRFQRRGRCPHRPAGCVFSVVKKTDTPIPSAPPAAEWHTVRISVTVSFSRISKFQKIQKSLLTNNRPGVTIMT